MNYKSTLSIIFLLISLSTYSQNKKEQIQILNNKIDSLTNLSKEESLKFTALNNEFKSTKNDLESTIQNKNEIIKNLNIDLSNQRKDADNKIDSLLKIYNRLKNQSKNDFNIITVNYANIVNGYKVKVAWLPNLERASDFITGPAVIQFLNINDSLLFSVNTNNYALKKDLFSITYIDKDSLAIASLNTSKVTIKYKLKVQIDRSDPIDFENEFCFVDVDFDGKKDLLVRDFGIGQRGNSNYDVYDLDFYSDKLKIYQEIFKKSQVPFNEIIDDLTEFDYVSKTITIGGSSGACSSQSTTYLKQDDEFIPSKYVKIDNDNPGFNCTEYTYKINRNLQLIKKEILKD